MITDNILKIKERVRLACARCARQPEDIIIVAVAKNRSADEIKNVISAGVFDIGGNFVQESLLKYNELRAMGWALQNTKWHMVGHLQTNKVKEAVKTFDLIQSVDTLSLAQEIDKQAGRINKVQDILFEIKTSEETTKFGLKPEEMLGIIRDVAGLKNINIRGLMTIAPLTDAPEKSRPYFKMLRELRERIRNFQIQTCDLQFLSMGMTDDFEVAIEEGSNMIRIGRAIFESSE